MKNEIECPLTRASDVEGQTEAARQQWDGVAAGWRKWWRTIEDGARCVSERLIELAEVERGQRVLDIATGFGEPALLVAARVGRAGRVVATDLSPCMLEIARERATASGLTNVEFVQADAARLDLPDGGFDAVLCRWGITSLPNALETLVAIRRLLTPKGLFATSVWEEGPKGRPLASVAANVARQMFDSPSSGPVVPSASVSAGSALDNQMRDAGFFDIRLEKMTLTLTFLSADDCAQYLLDVSPDLASFLSGKSSAQQAAYRHSLVAALQPYVSRDRRVRVENATVCAVGRR